MNKFGSKCWTEVFQNASEAPTSKEPKWEEVKSNIKQTFKDGNVTQWCVESMFDPRLSKVMCSKIIEAEKSDLTWKSIIFNLPRNVLSFAVRSCIDFLSMFTNLYQMQAV